MTTTVKYDGSAIRGDLKKFVNTLVFYLSMSYFLLKFYWRKSRVGNLQPENHIQPVEVLNVPRVRTLPSVQQTG